MGDDFAGQDDPGSPGADGSLTLSFRFAILRSSKENEYFQFFTNLQLLSRVEAEFPIFHPQAPFALKGSECRGFGNLHQKETVRVLASRGIHPGMDSAAADFHTLGYLNHGVFHHPNNFRDSGAFFHPVACLLQYQLV
jgi:hypothetical protein